jgi:hypothetical protein
MLLLLMNSCGHSLVPCRYSLCAPAGGRIWTGGPHPAVQAHGAAAGPSTRGWVRRTPTPRVYAHVRLPTAAATTVAHEAAVVQAHRTLDPGGSASHEHTPATLAAEGERVGVRARPGSHHADGEETFKGGHPSLLPSITTPHGVFELSVYPALRRLHAMGHVRSSDVRRISSRAQVSSRRCSACRQRTCATSSSAQGSSSGGGSSNGGGSGADCSTDGSTEGFTTQSEEYEAEGEQQHERHFGALHSQSIPDPLGGIQLATPAAIRAVEKLMQDRAVAKKRRGPRKTRAPSAQPWARLAVTLYGDGGAPPPTPVAACTDSGISGSLPGLGGGGGGSSSGGGAPHAGSKRPRGSSEPDARGSSKPDAPPRGACGGDAPGRDCGGGGTSSSGSDGQQGWGGRLPTGGERLPSRLPTGGERARYCYRYGFKIGTCGSTWVSAASDVPPVCCVASAVVHAGQAGGGDRVGGPVGSNYTTLTL